MHTLTSDIGLKEAQFNLSLLYSLDSDVWIGSDKEIQLYKNAVYNGCS